MLHLREREAVESQSRLILVDSQPHGQRATQKDPTDLKRTQSPMLQATSLRHSTRMLGASGWVLAVLSLAACQPAPQRVDLGVVQLVPVVNPAGSGAIAPNLITTSRGPMLTWLEPPATTEAGEDAKTKTWRVRTSRLVGDDFAPASTVVAGSNFFANWADFPALAEHPSGALVVHHLAKLGLGTYAYGAHLSVNTSQGSSNGPTGWNPLGLLHDDQSLTEHGFVSFAQDGDQLRAFWLDGREMAVDGPMTLRTTLIRSQSTVEAASADITTAGIAVEPPGASEMLDDRVCECCQTDAATTSNGPVVVYRNRSDAEIRDIQIVRQTEAGWTEPERIHRDGWEIQGCPVNGPAVAASGSLVAVAWFTGANDRPLVQLSISRDAGASFDPPIQVTDAATTGRVDVAISSVLNGSDIWVSHLSAAPESLRVSSTEDPGTMSVLLDHFRVGPGSTERGSTSLIAQSSEARASGFPRLAVTADDLVIAWTDSLEPSHVRTAKILHGAQRSAARQ